MSGHYAPNQRTNEVWGLTLYQKENYITCSDDGTVRIWNLATK
jgi:WD40 repeat protein